MTRYLYILILFIYLFIPLFSSAISASDINVVELQNFLESKGFLVMPSGVSKGVFGSLTKKALITYQKSVGLPAQGIFGPLTKAKIAEELSVKSDNNMVVSVSSTNSSTSDEVVTKKDLQAIYNMIAQSQRIDNLSNVNITGSSITGISSDNVSEGQNLYYTDGRVDSRLSATTSLPNITNLNGLTSIGSSLSTTTLNGNFSLGAYIPTNTSNGILAASVLYSPNDYINIMAFGAKGDGSTDDTSSIANAFSFANQSGNCVYIPKGTFMTHTITAITSGTCIKGSGINSILKSIDGSTVIDGSGSILSRIVIRDLSIDVNGTSFPASSGNGIYLHTSPYPVYNTIIDNVTITDSNGKAVYLPNEFSTVISNVRASSNNDNAFEVQGSITTTFLNTYALKVGTGKAGYRIYDGRPTFISANGISGGGVNTDWGVFGRSISEDGVETYVDATLIGSNLEDFSRYGIRLKVASAATFINTSIIAPSSGSVTGILYQSPNETVIKNADRLMFYTNGGTWNNSKPIHSTTAKIPLYGYGLTDFYDDTDSITVKMANPSLYYSSFANRSYRVSDAYFDILRQGLVLSSGTAVTITSGFGTSPTIAGSDTAFRVTLGNPVSTSGVVALKQSWPHAPVVVCNNETTNSGVKATPSTTSVTLSQSSGTWVAGDVISCIAIGY